jgi:hypothetical protein
MLTLTALQSLEATLGIKLPEFYTKFMQNYPSTLRDTTLYIGGSPQTPAQWEFASLVEKLLELNIFFRESEIEWTEAGPWPTLFVIGEDIGGDYFAISLADNTSEVFCFEHEDGRFVTRTPSLDDDAHQILQEYRNYNERQKS